MSYSIKATKSQVFSDIMRNTCQLHLHEESKPGEFIPAKFAAEICITILQKREDLKINKIQSISLDGICKN